MKYAPRDHHAPCQLQGTNQNQGPSDQADCLRLVKKKLFRPYHHAGWLIGHFVRATATAASAGTLTSAGGGSGATTGAAAGAAAAAGSAGAPTGSFAPQASQYSSPSMFS